MSRAFICRHCRVIPDIVREEGHRDVVRCPSCGVFGDREKVVESAAQHVASGSLMKHIQNRRRGQFRGSKTIRYVPGKLPNRPTPDFIFE